MIETMQDKFELRPFLFGKYISKELQGELLAQQLPLSSISPILSNGPGKKGSQNVQFCKIQDAQLYRVDIEEDDVLIMGSGQEQFSLTNEELLQLVNYKDFEGITRVSINYWELNNLIR